MIQFLPGQLLLFTTKDKLNMCKTKKTVGSQSFLASRNALCPSELVIVEIYDIPHIWFIASFLLTGIAGKSDVGIHELLGVHVRIAEDPFIGKIRITGKKCVKYIS